jgi:hypothetical protein
MDHLHDEGHCDVESDEVHDEDKGIIEKVRAHRAVVRLICPQLSGRKREGRMEGKTRRYR